MRHEIIVFGGTGGLGKQVVPLLRSCYTSYGVIGLGSKDVDITSASQVADFFAHNPWVSSVINLSGYNADSMLHKGNNNHTELLKVIEINAVGTLNILAGCLPGMRERKFGRIVLSSSIVAAHPLFGTGVYSGAKAFIESLAKACAIENAKYGINCNALQLGYFNGGMMDRITPDIQKVIVDSVPVKRLGTVLELFNAIRFCLDTEFLTGAVIPLNGGKGI